MAANDPVLPGERSVRFGCGALLGVILGVYVGAEMASASGATLAACVVGGALVCGLLAAAKGDRFWHSLLLALMVDLTPSRAAPNNALQRTRFARR